MSPGRKTVQIILAAHVWMKRRLLLREYRQDVSTLNQGEDCARKGVCAGGKRKGGWDERWKAKCHCTPVLFLHK